MRSILVSFIMICFAVSVSSQTLNTLIEQVKRKTSLQSEHLSGYVIECIQSIHEPAYDSLGKIIAGKRIEIFSENFLHAYNDSGFIEEEIQYKAENIIMTRRSYEYDANYRTLVEIVYDANDKILNKFSFKYDLRGMLVEKTVFKKTSKWQYNYDKAGNLIEIKDFQNEGKLGSRTEFKYDEKNQLIEETLFTGEGKPNIKDVYSYDELGFVVQRIHTIFQMNINQQFVYTYQTDDKGNWIQKTEYKAGKPYRVYIRKIKYQKVPGLE